MFVEEWEDVSCVFKNFFVRKMNISRVKGKLDLDYLGELGCFIVLERVGGGLDFVLLVKVVVRLSLFS